MSTRFLRTSYRDLEEAVKDISTVANSHLRDDAQPERWEVLRTTPVVNAATTPGLDVFKNGIRTWAFNETTTEELYYMLSLPHAYKEGTSLKPVVSWAPSTAGGTGGVKWGLEYVWQNQNSAFSAAATTIFAYQSVTTAQYHYLNASFTEISVSANITGIILCRFFRDTGDASDNYGADAYLLDFKFHIYHDTSRGSQYEFVKFDR